jgi:hypothetical protein
MRAVLFAILCTAGCIVGEGTTEQGGTGGGGGGGDGMATVDGGTAAACTNAVYDPCTDPAQCMSGRCQLFEQQNMQVCTTTCTPGDSTTCPMQNGQPATCNNKGICKPPAANSCSR